MLSVTITLFFDSSWDRDSKVFEVFEISLKTIYLLDIILKLNTGYFESGVIIKDRRKIAKHYLKRKMSWDLISVLVLFGPLISTSEPTTQHTCGLCISIFNSYKLFFFVKVYQLIDIYHVWEEILQNDDNIEGILSLLKLFLQVVFIAHLMACVWNYIGLTERDKGNGTWFDKYTNIDFRAEWTTQYVFALYWSLATMVTVGYGDVSATNRPEVIFSIVSMIFGCGFFAYAINSIGLILENFKENKKILR